MTDNINPPFQYFGYLLMPKFMEFMNLYTGNMYDFAEKPQLRICRHMVASL